jgi:HlyD family secretion protein
VQQIRLNPTTQQNVVTYNVRVSLSNPDQILLPGMTAYVSIAVASRDDALLVPNAALRFKPSETNGQRRQTGRWPPAVAGSATSAAAGAEARGKERKRDSASGTVYRDRAGRR